MQVSHAIRERRSIRAFLPEPVSRETVQGLLDLAKWSPSWANTQDWNVYVLDGEALERVVGAYEVLGEEEIPPDTDLVMPSAEWPEYLAARMNYRRPAPEAAEADSRSIANFYGAPCLILLAIDEALELVYSAFDAGLFAQTLCLAAEDRGFSTCIMARAVRYADVLHEVIPQAEGKRFLIGIALGMADHAALVNRGERERVETDELVSFAE
jgi:nitroreductase